MNQKYRVIKPFTHNAIPQTVGSTIELNTSYGKMYLAAGRVERIQNLPDAVSERMAIQGENVHPIESVPYVTDFDSLVIPFNCADKYKYWQSGQSPADTLIELGRKDLIPLYAGKDSPHRETGILTPMP